MNASTSSGENVARKIVAAAFDEDQLHVRMPLFELRDRGEVHRGIVADRRVRAAAGLDADDAVRRQRVIAHEELRVFARVDVVRHDGDRELIAQPLAEPQDQHGFARADRAADADAHGAF